MSLGGNDLLPATTSRSAAGMRRSTAAAPGFAGMGRRRLHGIVSRDQFNEIGAAAGFAVQIFLVTQNKNFADCVTFFTFIFVNGH